MTKQTEIKLRKLIRESIKKQLTIKELEMSPETANKLDTADRQLSLLLKIIKPITIKNKINLTNQDKFMNLIGLLITAYEHKNEYVIELSKKLIPVLIKKTA